MRRWAIVAALIAAFWSAPAANGGGEDARAVLGRVRDYLAWYERQLVTLVADERYLQRANLAERVLESEFGWVTLAGLGETVGVREVLRVDGRAVSGSSRLRSLLQHPGADPSAEVRAILAESATHNIGDVQRNINFPTFALAYLRRAGDRDTKWGAVRVGDHVDLRFEERERSTLVRTPEGARTPASGRFSVDPASGRIHACELRVRVRDRLSSYPIVYWMRVDFAADRRLDLWLPVRMLERHYREFAPDDAAGDTGEASYSNYRRYETAGRLIQ